MSRRVVLDKPPVAALCTDCGASILWVFTDADARMPVDYDNADDGTWIVWHYDEEEPVPRLHASVERIYRELYGEPVDKRRWRMHWLVCPRRRSQRGEPVDKRQLTLFNGGAR